MTLAPGAGAPAPAPSRGRAALAAGYYVASSCVLTMAVKTVFNRRGDAVSAPLLLLAQACTTLLLFGCARCAGLWRVPALPSSRAALRAYAPLLVAYAAMLTTSVVALRLTSLLMYNALRRTSLLFVVIAQARATRAPPSAHTIFATALTLAGAACAGLFDLGFDPVGYTLAFAANLGTALYLVQLKSVRDTLGYTNLEFLFVNTLSILPLLAALIFVLPPERPLLPALRTDSFFATVFAAACVLTFFLNHSTYVNTVVNDPVAQTVSAQVKDLILLVVSVTIIDNPQKRSAGNIAGVLVGFAGSLVYGYGKLRELGAESSSGPHYSDPTSTSRSSVRDTSAAISRNENHPTSAISGGTLASLGLSAKEVVPVSDSPCTSGEELLSLDSASLSGDGEVFVYADEDDRVAESDEEEELALMSRAVTL